METKICSYEFGKWVAIKDQPPRMGERVILTDGYFIGEGYRGISDNYFRWGYPWIEDSPPTHWMPYPSPPEEN